MKVLSNKKGTILIASYLVLFVIIIIASSLFVMLITEGRIVNLEKDAIKALNYAEKGIAYAFYESENLGWQWYTHKWNDAKDTLLALEPSDASYQEKLRTDCSFDENGFYVANNGEFMIKAYPDQQRENETVILAMGISGNTRRVIKYALARKGIYDFFYYSPYNIDLDSAVTNFPRLNGGGIHSNGDIYFDAAVRLENISELSTGEKGKIYYTCTNQYAPPYAADLFDGAKDAQAPIVRLDNPADVFNKGVSDPGPFGYYWGNKVPAWYWKTWAQDFASSWPSIAYRTSEWYFSGDSKPWNNIGPGAKDSQVSNTIVNDNTIPLNKYNVWIKPYLGLDEGGNILSGKWAQIPSELDQAWAWSKYKGDAYGSGNGNGELPVSFYTYDNSGNKVAVNNTWWDIESGNVVWVDQADLTNHPKAKSYWDMFKSPEYWQAKGNYPGVGYKWPDYFNPEISDGIYGNDRVSGGTLNVKHLDSLKQSDAWKQFLKDSGLDGIVRDANTGGEYLEPPQFGSTYGRLAQKDGLYIGLDEAFDGEFSNFDEWQQVLEKSIDAAVEKLNSGEVKDVARKAKFINTNTGKWNVVLDIDLGKMQEAGKHPRNGVIYTKVPIRLSNAKHLPREKDNYGLTVLGEENVYLKGDYNTENWVTSAVISKKRLFTLSDNFNDPQVKPATDHFRDYPYMYVKKDTITGVWSESDSTKGGGTWVYRDQLNSAINDYYPLIPDGNEQVLKDRIDAKDTAYRSLFNKNDPTGTATATFSWAASNENYTYGMMPNWVLQNQTYNCLVACNRGTNGSMLEKWDYRNELNTRIIRNKYLNGAYFILPNYDPSLDAENQFTAPLYNFVDYEPNNENNSKANYLPYDRRGRLASGTTNSNAGFGITSPRRYLSYDSRFKTGTRSPSDIFFGGAEALWIESSVAYFNKMSF